MSNIVQIINPRTKTNVLIFDKKKVISFPNKPKNIKTVWECNCGSQDFNVTPESIICSRCETEVGDIWS